MSKPEKSSNDEFTGDGSHSWSLWIDCIFSNTSESLTFRLLEALPGKLFIVISELYLDNLPVSLIHLVHDHRSVFYKFSDGVYVTI